MPLNKQSTDYFICSIVTQDIHMREFCLYFYAWRLTMGLKSELKKAKAKAKEAANRIDTHQSREEARDRLTRVNSITAPPPRAYRNIKT